MDSVLHIAGLAFIPMIIYIIYLGTQDIISTLRDHYGPQWQKATARKESRRHQGIFRGIYEFTT
ncbi:MAG: hypothetical protein COB54_06635 [Alphaproteobacteria bacterium]|nr:MAG: hypothetical protein COB54_06635 [Alphaproteobacteria bacterium]